MRRRSGLWKHANLVVPGGLDDFVLTRRTAGLGWRLIARELWVTTDGEVDLTHETLRRWYPDDANGDDATEAA